MSANNSFASKLRARLRVRSQVQSWWLSVGAVLIALAVLGPSTGIVAKGEAGKHLRVSGAGKTMIEGGTGGTAPVPVTTGLGAGQDVPFTALVHAGGPGTTVHLDVSGLTFPEILVDGHISIE